MKSNVLLKSPNWAVRLKSYLKLKPFRELPSIMCIVHSVTVPVRRRPLWLWRKRGKSSPGSRRRNAWSSTTTRWKYTVSTSKSTTDTWRYVSVNLGTIMLYSVQFVLNISYKYLPKLKMILLFVWNWKHGNFLKPDGELLNSIMIKC